MRGHSKMIRWVGVAKLHKVCQVDNDVVNGKGRQQCNFIKLGDILAIECGNFGMYGMYSVRTADICVELRLSCCS